MVLFDSVTQVALVTVVLYASWAILRPFVVKSPLNNLPGPKPSSWISGSLNQYLSPNCWDFRADLARNYGRVSVINAFFGRKWVEVWDVKALHAIFVKDQDIYEEPNLSMRIVLGPGLLGTVGTQHKRQRKMLNPVFSVKHLREMTPLFYQVIHKTRDAILERVRAKADAQKDGVELDMLSWMGRTTLEVLGQAGLGHSFDPLTEDRPDEFANAVKNFFPQMVKTIVIRVLLPIVSQIGTPAFRRRLVEMIPFEDVRRLKDISDTMHNRSVQIFNEKKAALEKGDDSIKHQLGEGRDVMSILLRENMTAAKEDRLPDDELIAQVSTMILAGMDTTANSLARILELLADHPDVQERLRTEIQEAVEAEGDGDMCDFDKVMELPYLEAVCRETLRVTPGVSILFRETTRDIIMPLSEATRMRDGTLSNAIPIPKGTRVVPNITSCNRDPALWGPDADQWRPERWLEPLPRAVYDAQIPGVYSHLMTFVGGSRACIGFKFAQVEMKTVLFVLLQYFKFEPSGKPIVWNFAAVQYPSVGKPGSEPCLPLKVSLLHP